MSVYMRSGKYVCLRPQFIAERCALSIHDLILRSADYCSHDSEELPRFFNTHTVVLPELWNNIEAKTWRNTLVS